MSSGILTQDRPTSLELAACALALATLGALVFGSHIENGGRYSDDWPNAAMFHFEAHDQFGLGIERFRDLLGGRPVLVVALAGLEALWRHDIGAQLTLAVALAGAASLLFFGVLRTLGLRAGWAGAAAVLSFVYPWADASRLWAVAGPQQLCLIFYFAGFLIAAHGLRRGGTAGGLWHAAAIGFYLLSVSTYEAAAPAIVLTGMLYTALVGWSRARARWAADVGVILPAVVGLFVLDSSTQVTPGFHSMLAGVRSLPSEATRQLLQSFVPIPVTSRGRALIVVLVVAGLVVALRRLSPVSRRGLLGPAALFAASLVGAVVAWWPFIGAGLPPTAPGVDNRGNLGAAFAVALGVVAIARVGEEIVPAVGRRQWAAQVAAVLIAGAIGAGWVITAGQHADAYDRAARGQEQLLADLTTALPSPPSGATVYTVAHAAQAAPGVPVFSETWDLNGAVKLAWNDGTLRGFPIVGSARLSCGQRSVIPHASPLQATAVLEEGYGPRQAAPYGRAFIYDARMKRAFRIDGVATCRNVARSARSGEIVSGSSPTALDASRGRSDERLPAASWSRAR